MSKYDGQIQLIKGQIEDAIERLARLEDFIKEDEEYKNEKLSFEDGEIYYSIRKTGCRLALESNPYYGCDGDFEHRKDNNMFKKKEEAEDILGRIKFLLKLYYYKRICEPDWKPDWNSIEQEKYYIYYDRLYMSYRVEIAGKLEEENQVYFGDNKIAEHVCELLNEERKNEEC